MTHPDADQRAIVPFAEHRPETVPVAVWVEYVRLMAVAGQGKLSPQGVTQLDAIYARSPEIVDAGRGLDFTPRCSR